MFYATLSEKLAFVSILLKASEKIRLEQDRFDIVDMEELVFPYTFLMSSDFVENKSDPLNFLLVFNTLVDPAYLDKKFERTSIESSLRVDNIEVSKIEMNLSKEIVNTLNSNFMLGNMLEHITSDFKIRNAICDSVIRSIEAFSHYVVIRNLGLPISKLDRSRCVECEAPRIMLYNLLESSKDIPQFIALLQTEGEKKILQKNEYHFLKDNEVIRTFLIYANALPGEELARALISKFKYSDPRLFEEIGVWFPERIYNCSRCKKAIPSFEKRHIDNCKGGEVGPHHLPTKMDELSGIVIHKNLSQAFPYISEYLVVHSLRRLLFTDKLFGFLAHSVLFDDEEIDIIALVLFKNYVKIFPIEVQISTSIDMKKTYEKFQKLEEKFLKNIKYPEGHIKIHNIFITFEVPKEKCGKNFLIRHFSELDESIRNLIYYSV